MDAKKLFIDFLQQYARQMKEYYENRQKEYNELANEMTELGVYIETMSSKLLVLNMDDQMAVMRKIIELGKIEKEMCEKYNISIYEDSDYEEDGEEE